MKTTEKEKICLNCEHFKNSKCSLVKCMSCYNQLMNSRFGKCPAEKWIVNLKMIMNYEI